MAEVRDRTAELGQRVDEFLVASIRDWTGRAARMLARDPWIAGYDFRTAVILGDATRVRQMLAGDPGLATRPDERTGWTALHAACASRWHDAGLSSRRLSSASQCQRSQRIWAAADSRSLALLSDAATAARRSIAHCWSKKCSVHTWRTVPCHPALAGG